MEENGEKSHDPTPKRRQDAREKGQVAKSQDLAAALMLLVTLLLLMSLGKQLCFLFLDYSKSTYGGGAWLQADLNNISSYVIASTFEFMKHLAIIFLLLVVAGVLVNLAQIGILFLPDKLAFDFTRLDPMKGMKRIFSMQSVMRLVMGIVKIIICAIVAYYACYREIETILALNEFTELQISAYMLQLLIMIAIKVAVALVIIAIIDYMYQKWKHEQDLKMTTQELRDEMKNTIGNPEILSKRRQIQREMAQQRLGQSVPQADVVVTNPTELAIALRYDPETMDAPIVIAKGAGFIAQKIRRIALEHGIPIVEKKPLAQALYKKCQIDQPIPREEYAAVAEVLSHIYRLKKKSVPTPKYARA